MLFDLKSDELSAYTTLATAAIAFVALIITYIQLRVSKRESRLGVAKGIYKDYLALAFANPKFSSASYPLHAPIFKTFANNSEEHERYEFFISYLLFAAEEILELTKNSLTWRATLRDQLRYHALFLDGKDFLEYHYSSDILTLRDEAIAAYKEGQNVTNTLRF